MNARSIAPPLVLVLAFVVAGCAVAPADHGALTKDGYKAVFAQVIRKTLGENRGDNVCLPQFFGNAAFASDTLELPLDPGAPQFYPNVGRLPQMRALESVGLVVGVESERTVNDKLQRFATFRRTAKGDASFANGTFCYARAELDDVVKWKGPIALGDYRAAFVYYTVRISHVADWARVPAVMAAFPTTVPIAKGEPSKVRQVAIDLSSEGWDVAEYSKLIQIE